MASAPCTVSHCSPLSHACKAVLWDTDTELRLLRDIDFVFSQLAFACISHIGLQALNQSDMCL